MYEIRNQPARLQTTLGAVSLRPRTRDRQPTADYCYITIAQNSKTTESNRNIRRITDDFDHKVEIGPWIGLLMTDVYTGMLQAVMALSVFEVAH